MSEGYVLTGIAVGAVVTLTLRALPFLLFTGKRRMPVWLERLGQLLPSSIMAVLIVYCLKGAKSEPAAVGLPGLLAVALVAVSYKWKHNTFLSIAAGTAFYMVLIRVL